MTRALLLLSIVCSGCLIVPAKKTTTKAAGNEYGSSTFAVARSIELSTSERDGVVNVHAIRHGECVRPVFAVTEIKSERKAKLGGADDPRALVFAAPLALVTIPVSALITGLVLAGDEPVTTRATKEIGTERRACSEEAEQLALEVRLPSGTVTYTSTDTHGDAKIEVPHSEPQSGLLTVTASGAAPREVNYSLPRTALAIARDAVHECGVARGLSGTIELKLNINERGHATRLWLSQGDADMRVCVSQRISGQRYPERTWAHTITLPLTIAAPAAASL